MRPASLKKRKSLLHKHSRFVNYLYYSYKKNPIRGSHIIKNASSEEIKTLIEIIGNFLENNFPDKCKSRLCRKLYKHKHFLRSILRHSQHPEYVRTKLKNQKGGAIITSLIAPLIGSLVSGIIAKNV